MLRNGSTQIHVTMKSSEAIKTLQSNGFTKTMSKDGQVTVLTSENGVWRFYNKSTSGDLPSGSFTPSGASKAQTKLRFPKEE